MVNALLKGVEAPASIKTPSQASAQALKVCLHIGNKRCSSSANPSVLLKVDCIFLKLRAAMNNISPFFIGSIVHGSFHCRKSEGNSRELDVEIHFSIKQEPDGPASEVVVQMFKVR